MTEIEFLGRMTYWKLLIWVFRAEAKLWNFAPNERERDGSVTSLASLYKLSKIPDI